MGELCITLVGLFTSSHIDRMDSLLHKALDEAFNISNSIDLRTNCVAIRYCALKCKFC